jgi:hypothetical protein
MMDGTASRGEARFWKLAAPLLERAGVSRSTMMGFPCLRLAGDFFATCDHRTGHLVVKLNEHEDVVANLHRRRVGTGARWIQQQPWRTRRYEAPRQHNDHRRQHARQSEARTRAREPFGSPHCDAHPSRVGAKRAPSQEVPRGP